jgi:3-dehydro-L-gulonate 2-dehydrogenase
MLRIPFAKLYDELLRVFVKLGFQNEDAQLLAQTLAENTCDGVASHGLNRIHMIVSQIKKGHVKVAARAEKVSSFGAWEQWHGHSGPGVLNAHLCTGRALELARQNGIGCVALRNTNHWMRGGTYGWKAASAGFAFICWTNTLPNMPPWGGLETRLGNNPFVIAVPRVDGPLVLDMAMTQFSYGKLETLVLRDEKLPFDGGLNRAGHLTKEPKEILESQLGLPIGYWKGAGLALMLDILAATLSCGNATFAIGQRPSESDVSQMYIAFDLARVGDADLTNKVVDEIIRYTKSARVKNTGEEILYPGERALRTRQENLDKGIAVDAIRWQELLAM